MVRLDVDVGVAIDVVEVGVGVEAYKITLNVGGHAGPGPIIMWFLEGAGAVVALGWVEAGVTFGADVSDGLTPEVVVDVEGWNNAFMQASQAIHLRCPPLRWVMRSLRRGSKGCGRQSRDHKALYRVSSHYIIRLRGKEQRQPEKMGDCR